ncbi:MAG: hypothetical protein OEX07_05240 [Gammaproteobacteria bacterium]|nr:hypothetical protein [Gammaproteobacteria bacterium]
MFKNCLIIAASIILFACDSSEPASNSAHTESPEKTILDEHCRHCHVPPLPSAHSVDEWYNVVYRMQKHRLKRGLQTLTDEEFDLVVSYLKQRAEK